jgi:hypothetical protein
MGKQLEVAATLFFWWLAIEISFLPTMKNHHVKPDKTTKQWETTVNKVIIAGLVAASLNFFEKIIIQLIAISFHLRTYADRIEINKFQISSLVKLYVYSKEKIAMEDSEFELGGATNSTNGARTPMQYAIKAQKNARQAFNKVGDVAGKVAGDFTGKQVATSTHPHQVYVCYLCIHFSVLTALVFFNYSVPQVDLKYLLAVCIEPLFKMMNQRPFSPTT